MSSDGHHIDVMTGKAWVFGVFLVAVLTVRVSNTYCMEHDCRSHIESNLLRDHYLMIKDFTAPGEKIKEEHTFLSIIVMMCSSLKENKDFYINDTDSKSDHFEKLIWGYVDTLSNWSNCDHNLTDALKFCENYNCSHSYNTSYITPNQFCNMCEIVTKTTPLPECPKPISVSIPTMHTSTSSTSTSTSSDSYTTTPAVSEYPSTPAPTSTTVTHNTNSEIITSSTGIKGAEKRSTEQVEDLRSLLPVLFLVASLLLNFILGVHFMKRKKKWRLFTNPVQEQSDTKRDSLNCEHRKAESEVQLELNEESII